MDQFTNALKKNRNGEQSGVYSVCSAHPLVIEAAMEQALSDGTMLLIEATANQVNQFGGYTGMRPADFREFVEGIASKVGFARANLMLGGDHLGPVCWCNEQAEDAMEKALTLIEEYVGAGFQKIHLDCSMACADDTLWLDDITIATRAALLCEKAEQTARTQFGSSDILYIIGTEVPPPGGTNEEVPEIEVTKAEHAHKTLADHKKVFQTLGLDDAWERVCGLVVQPGVEFSHTSVVQYDPAKAATLKSVIAEVDRVVFEAHSTDYQMAEKYHDLVRDHFAILKVGPELTFALREGLYALSHIEDHLIPQAKRSNLIAVCEQQMVENPVYWSKFYQVEEKDQYFYRHFSYSDRIRYYWPNEAIKTAVDKLIDNLSAADIPLPLISQYFPKLYSAVADNKLLAEPEALVKACIKIVLLKYSSACFQNKNSKKMDR